jgi:gliding motility-associated-like protein
MSLSIMLELLQDDTLVAVFNVTPHISLTVMVDPPYSGTVNFAGEYLTVASQTVDIEANIPHEFIASPNEYWEFKNWTSLHASPIAGSTPENVKYVFLQSDTVIAHFTKEDYTMFIPNSFSPNNDGTNDIFLPRGVAIDPDSYHLMIFNRWGEKVFDTKDINKPWEGDHLGGEYYVPEESYQYILKAKSVHDAEPREYTGSILVIR